MPLELADYEDKARDAIKAFWGNRAAAAEKQRELGRADQGERAGVTGGKNMDGFLALIQDLVRGNGLSDAHMMVGRRVLTLPGYFRPTKLWDLLIINDRRLVAALELKSQVGPSFGNNFNNRTEEALGTAIDLKTALREGAFGPDAPPPFVGWLMLVEDADGSRTPVRDSSPHFRVFPEFQGASYLERYNILCRKLVQEQLYTTATVIASPRSAVSSGDYAELAELTGLKTFVTSFAGHIAAEAARAPTPRGGLPISTTMGPRYLDACRTVIRIIDTLRGNAANLDAISEAKGMFNRVARHDQRDWQDVAKILGQPETEVCRDAATWLTQLRSLIQAGESLGAHCAAPIAKRVRAALQLAMTELEMRGTGLA